MLEVFLAGFLGTLAGAGFLSFLFYRAYLAERAMSDEMARKMLQLMSGEARTTKTGSVLSLFKNDEDKNKPVN